MITMNRCVELFKFTITTVVSTRFIWYLVIMMIYVIYFEAGRGAAARGVTAKPTGCGFDPHSRR